MRAVYEFHLRLTDQDLSESVAAKAKYGAVFYFGLYPSDTPGLAVLHGRRVLRGIRNRIRIKENDVYDPRREDWLVKQFRDLLGSPPTPSGLT